MMHSLAVPYRLQRHFATILRGDLPAGLNLGPTYLPQIWMSFNPIWWIGTGDAAPVRCPPVMLIGPTSSAVSVLMERPTSFPGWSFWPLGWSEIVGMPAEELRDQCVDASTLWPVACDRLLQSMAQARNQEEKDACTICFAADLSALARPSQDELFIEAIDAWLAGPNPIDSLTYHLGFSRRQTERIVARTHGFSPRLMSAKQRTMRAAARLGLKSSLSPSLWDEYADQSHFNREFRRFVGMTPRAFLGEDTLARDVLASDWQRDTDHPLSLHEQQRR